MQSPATPAARLSQQDIEKKIVGAQFYRFTGTTLTVCCLHLANGFTVTDESACVSEANFDAEVGQRLAREDAVRKVWQLEGYLLRERLAMESNAALPPAASTVAEDAGHAPPVFLEPPVLGERPAEDGGYTEVQHAALREE